ncbi:hypothetical protein B0O99DRAFT_628870 [Bisporella sp. PMI_857]|nr:hypothetical protein B0O99DRAFT_628870 [Bisporella sp. PMI_857]
MSNLRVTLRPVESKDWKAVAWLEAIAFGEDEFSQVAFGSRRFDDEVIEARAKEMQQENQHPGESQTHVKAVLLDDDGTEEIVGYAGWRTVLVSQGGVGVYGTMNEERESEDSHEGEHSQKKDTDEDCVKTVANRKLCDDLFIPGDRYMASACEGKDYHKLFLLEVSPKHQRRGIGSLLLESGLKEADLKGLQCVLGASPEGLGLYRKHGFVTTQHMSLNLWEYEGGEGKGTVEHCIMHRPAKAQVSS